MFFFLFLLFFFVCVCTQWKKIEWKKQHLFLHKDYIYIPEVDWINPVSIFSLPNSPWNHECDSKIYGILSVKICFGRYVKLQHCFFYIDFLEDKGKTIHSQWDYEIIVSPLHFAVVNNAFREQKLHCWCQCLISSDTVGCRTPQGVYFGMPFFKMW